MFQTVLLGVPRASVTEGERRVAEHGRLCTWTCLSVKAKQLQVNT